MLVCYYNNIKTSINLRKSVYLGIFNNKDEHIPEVKLSLCKCMD
jgi:hypothetical protein